MSDTSVNGYRIRVTQTEGNGSPWVVNVSRRGFPFRKTVSSDWFLDGEQAKRFADQCASELSEGGGVDNLRDRKPGWTLHRPVR